MSIENYSVECNTDWLVYSKYLDRIFCFYCKVLRIEIDRR